MRQDTGLVVRSALVAALLSALVAGCSSGGSTPQAATLSPTPSASTTSVTPSASPTLTAEAQVEAAVRTYYAELTKSLESLDTSALRPLVSAGCPCLRAVEGIQKAKRRGQLAVGATWTVTSVNVHDLETSLAAAEVKYTVSPYDVFNAKGKRLAHYRRATSHVDLSFVRSRGGWIIANLFDLEA